MQASQLDQSKAKSSSHPSLLALLFALGIDALIIILYAYWFGVADRYRLFLYDHDMGVNVLDTSPFSPVTSSRYWMTGLVAAGAIMVLYLGLNWVLSRLRSNYNAPSWWHVWVLASSLLIIAIPAITLTANNPVLTARYAGQTTIVCILALTLALSPGRMAADRPVDLIWLVIDGIGLMLILVTLPGLQFLDRWLEQGQTLYILMLVFACAAGLAWLLVMTALRFWRRQFHHSAAELVLAGLAVSYLLLPLVHHLLFTDGYFYITDSDNFFARNILLQMLIWSFAAIVAVAVTGLRRKLEDSHTRRTAIGT